MKSKNNPWAICHASLGKDKNAKFERCVKKIKKKIKEAIVNPNARPQFPQRSNWRRAFKWAGVVPGVKKAMYSKPAQNVLSKVGLQKGFLEDPSSKWGAFLRGAELVPRWMPPGSPEPMSRGQVMGKMLAKYAGNPERQQDLIRRFKKVGTMTQGGKIAPSRKGYARSNSHFERDPRIKSEPERMTRPEEAPTPLRRKDYLQQMPAIRPKGAPNPLRRNAFLQQMLANRKRRADRGDEDELTREARESLAKRILNELSINTLKSYRAKAMKQDPTKTPMKREKGISQASTKITKAAQGKNTKKSVMGGTATQSSTSAYKGKAGDSDKQSKPMARSEINKARSSGQEAARAAANEKAFSKLVQGLAKKKKN